RRHQRNAHTAWLPDPEARRVDARRHNAVRAGEGPYQRPRVHGQTPAGVRQVPRQAAKRSDHRVEEPRASEGLRRGPQAAEGAAPGAGRGGGGPGQVLELTVSAEWYAIWTRSRHEQVVREQLERKHLEAFLPTITKWSRWKDRQKKSDWPLFPGYCFARFDPADTLPILKCTGVVNIVSFEGKPAAIPAIELDRIRLLWGVALHF